MKPPRLAAGAALSLLLLNAFGEQFYQTKTPYQPQQASASYEAAPQGYRAIHTQLLARHGSRGLSSMKTDLALYNLWQLASKKGALTPLGTQLGADLLHMMKANALLGYGVAGIGKPGYGNETMQGVTEHQQLAARMMDRLPQLFRDAAGGPASPPRQIILVTSGKDRAVDSGDYFAGALVARQPDLQALIVRPPSLAPRAETNHDSRPAGTDRFLLYFHKLGAKQDLVTDKDDPLYATYQARQAYQSWAKSEELRQRESAVLARPQVVAAAKAVMARLFAPAFIEGLDQGRYSAANNGTYSHTSADGKFTNKLTGDGDTVIQSSIDVAQALYDLYAAAADMEAELTAETRAGFVRYMPAPQAAVFAAAEDAIAFYGKGPGIRENGDVNYRMAQTLLDDFFAEVDAVAKGDLSHAAKLRFAHAEIVIPMAAILGLRGMSEQLPRATAYSYENSPWRGAAVAPMAANIQWDSYTNGARLLVRMLYNEKETDFKPACDHAKIAPRSHFYDYAQLRSCYGISK
jgi:hypothetical protein